MVTVMPGESEHRKGAEGAQSAKRWLERTTRVSVPWVNPDPIAVKKLTFQTPSKSTFSYDIGASCMVAIWRVRNSMPK